LEDKVEARKSVDENDKKIEERVVEIICKQLDVEKEKVSIETSFINDLGADSLDIVELVMEFEEEFNTNIPDEDAEGIRTVGDVVKYLKSQQAEA
jgi:acyl carrier protein